MSQREAVNRPMCMAALRIKMSPSNTRPSRASLRKKAGTDDRPATALIVPSGTHRYKSPARAGLFAFVTESRPARPRRTARAHAALLDPVAVRERGLLVARVERQPEVVDVQRASDLR